MQELSIYLGGGMEEEGGGLDVVPHAMTGVRNEEEDVSLPPKRWRGVPLPPPVLPKPEQLDVDSQVDATDALAA